MKNKLTDKIVVLTVTIYSLIVWWPTKSLPYYWDGAMFINRASRILLERNFYPLIAEYTDFAHPPLFILLHGGFIKLFGDTFLSAHVIIFPFLPLFIFLTYILAKLVMRDTLTALGASTLVATTPFVIAEYGQIYFDLPIAVLLLSALTAQLYRNTKLAAVLFTFSVMIKLNALILLPAVVWLAWSQERQRGSKRVLWYSLPVLSAIIWLIYHYYYTHWWFVIPDRNSYIPTTLNALANSLKEVTFALGVDQYRWIISTFALIGLTRNYRFWKKNAALTTYSIALVSITILYTLMGELLYRYLLPIYPLFIIISLHLLKQRFPNPIQLFSICVVTSFLFYSAWHPQTERLTNYLINSPEDLRYQDIIQVGKQTARYIETNYPSALVYGSHIESYQLPEPFQGYVTSPIQFRYCQYYQPETSRPVLIAYHLFSPLQPPCASLLKQVPSTLIKKFEVNGFWVDLYQVQATQLPKPKK